jgi:hypothetical protein
MIGNRLAIRGGPLCRLFGHTRRPFIVPSLPQFEGGAFVPPALTRRFGRELSGLRGLPIRYCRRCGDVALDFTLLQKPGPLGASS